MVLTTFGTLGDLYPYLAIAKGLQNQGHRPLIATSERYRQQVEAQSIEFYPVRPDSIPDFERDREFLSLMIYQKRAIEYVVCYMLMPHLRASYADLMAASGGADLLITHPLTFAGPLVAEKIGIPWVSCFLSPYSFSSAYDLQSYLWSGNIPLSSQEKTQIIGMQDSIARHFQWQARFWIAPWQQLRQELGLTPCNPLFDGLHSPYLVLGLFSEMLATPQPDWPDSTVVTGFPFYRPHNSEGLSAKLMEFLDSGEPPIAFTLGSLAVMSAGNFYIEAATALRELGYRAVLLMGKEAQQVSSESLPKGTIAVDYAPHSELFPRSMAIVHHGGIGTTGEAMLSGRPMLVVPDDFDRYDNAARIVSLGVGRQVSRDRYSATVLARELKQLLLDPVYEERAASVGSLLRAEDGVRRAVDAIEPLLRLVHVTA
ncbi:glycosyl transferase family 28 [Moorena producens PAL-8-15-08-1]|uniref:Glycosyl transferase family 28 n=1 Tax=Moorena producens PAL-8-15-08-1 TaxID=1458985 RepID=A0A1D8U378_9CYAN|nr:glycosyl transferase family 28 [Moorena producens PAL-8-15-08-1]